MYFSINFKKIKPLNNKALPNSLIQLLTKQNDSECNHKKKNCFDSLTGGNELVKRELADSRTNFYLVDTNNPINETGDVTSFRVYSENTEPLQLVIYRNIGEWEVVAKSDMKTPSCEGVNEFVLIDSIPVVRGDYVGIYFPNTGSVSFNRKSSNETIDTDNFKGTVLFTNSGNNPTDFSGSIDRTYSIKVYGTFCNVDKDVTQSVQCTYNLKGGNQVKKRENPDSRSNFYLVDTNNPINIDGEIDYFRIFAGTMLPVQLVIYRKGQEWSVVGKSLVKVPKSTGYNEFSIDLPIHVKKGDLVGMYYPQSGSVSFDRKSPSEAWDLGNLTGSVLFTESGKGPTEFSGSSNRIYSISVKGRECK